METPDPTPQEALQLLKQFVAHPGIRCFNLQEYEMAKRAIAILEKAVAEPQTPR
jgi:hypothetical protein